MGRFYQTVDPQLVDYVYKPPVELMGKVIEHTDSMIDKSLGTLAALPEAIKANGIEGVDKERVSAYVKDKEAQIAQIAKTIQDNPLEARKQRMVISKLASDISKDVSSGELANITSNRKTFDTWFEEQKKRMYGKDEFVTAEDISNRRARLLKEWNSNGGTSYKDGLGKQFNADPLTSAVNLQKEALTIGKDVKPDQYSNVTFDKKTNSYVPLGDTLFQSNDPAYLTKYANTIKVLNEDKVAGAVMSNLMNRSDVVNYYKQKVEDAKILGQNYTMEDALVEMTNAAQIAGKTLAFHEDTTKETLHENWRYRDNINNQQDLYKMNLKHGWDLAKEARDDAKEAKKKKEEQALGVVASMGVFQVPTNTNLVAMKQGLESKRSQLDKLSTLNNSEKDPVKQKANQLTIENLQESIKNDESQLMYAGRSVPYDMTKKFNEFRALTGSTIVPIGDGTNKSLSELTNEDIGKMSSDRGNGMGAAYTQAQLKQLIDLKLMGDNKDTFANSFYTNRLKSKDFIPNVTQGAFSRTVSPLTNMLASEEKNYTALAQNNQPVIKEEGLALVPIKGSEKESQSYQQLRGYVAGSIFKNITAFDVIDQSGKSTPIGDTNQVPITLANGKTKMVNTNTLLSAGDKSTFGQFKIDGKTITVGKFVDKEGNFIGTVNFAPRTEDQETVANSVYGTIADNLQHSDDVYTRQLANNAVASSRISHISRGLNANKMVEGQSNSYTDGNVRYTTSKDKYGNFKLNVSILQDGSYQDITSRLEKVPNLTLTASDSKGLDKVIYNVQQLSK